MNQKRLSGSVFGLYQDRSRQVQLTFNAFQTLINQVSHRLYIQGHHFSDLQIIQAFVKLKKNDFALPGR